MSSRPLVVLSITLLAGCPSADDGGSCGSGAAGDLVVELPDVALDEPVTAVVYDEAGAEIARVTETTSLPGLDGGTYFVVTERGIRYEPTSTIDTAHGALHDTVQAVCVGGDEPLTVAIEVAQQPSSGKLWVSAAESIVGLSAATLAAGPDVAVDARLDVALTNDFRGLSFDPSGNLWAAASPTYGTRLLVFRPDQVDGVGEQEAALVVWPGLDDGVQIADLWVDGDGTVWALVRFSYGEFSGLWGWPRAELLEALVDGGEVTLQPSIVHDMPELAGAEDLLAVGDDLFVSVFDTNRVFRYSRSSLTGTMTPAAEISFVDALDIEQPGPTNMAFSNGQIWLTLWTAPQIVPFSPTADGPVLTVPLSAGVTDLPSGMDADAAGTVWWGNLDVSGATELHRFDGATGDPGDTLTTPDLASPSDLVFDPAAR